MKIFAYYSFSDLYNESDELLKLKILRFLFETLLKLKQFTPIDRTKNMFELAELDWINFDHFSFRISFQTMIIEQPEMFLHDLNQWIHYEGSHQSVTLIDVNVHRIHEGDDQISDREHWYLITGMDEGNAIVPRIVYETESGIDQYLTCQGDSTRYYERFDHEHIARQKYYELLYDYCEIHAEEISELRDNKGWSYGMIADEVFGLYSMNEWHIIERFETLYLEHGIHENPFSRS